MAQNFAALGEKLTKGRLLLPGDDGFDDSLKRWSITCIKPAAAVAQPKTTQEVSEVVKFATANKIAFNVKGGGHSTSQSSSAPSPEGMVLDLSLMREVSVDPEAKSVTFQGGCLWRDVDTALWEHGLATVGGTVSHTGVGGLVLHGGFGMLTGLHGLAIDCLLSCEVVLADGSIVTASASENPDLFWALRGAGSSYGVITHFTSQAYPQGDIWCGVMIFSPDKLPAVVDFINKWAATNDGNQVLATAIGHLPPAPDAAPGATRAQSITCHMVQLGPNPEVDGPAFFAPLLELDSIIKIVNRMPYPMVNQMGDEAAFPARRRYQFGGSNFEAPMTLSTAEAICNKFWAFTTAHADSGAEGSVCVLEGIPNGVIRSKAASSTAYNNRGSYFNVGIVWTWEKAELDSTVRQYNREYQNEVRKLGYHDDVERKDGVGQYANYLGADAVAAEVAFGANSDRLRRLKTEYDPTNVFDKLWKLLGNEEVK